MIAPDLPLEPAPRNDFSSSTTLPAPAPCQGIRDARADHAAADDENVTSLRHHTLPKRRSQNESHV